jgi:hypothetical protein
MIYNYKDGPRYKGATGTPITQITNWHIGAHYTKTTCLLIAFIQALTNKSPSG